MNHEQRREQVMIIDDQPTNLKLLSVILMDAGYHVRIAPDAASALESAQEDVPDIFLIDVYMPEVDGFELCRQLKSCKTTRERPIIFLSAANDIESKSRGFEIGGCDYITKPFSSQEVLLRVQTHLSINRLQNNLQQQSEQLALKNFKLENALLQLRQTQDQLIENEKMAMLGRLSTGIAHDINTPIGAIESSSRTSQCSFHKLVDRIGQISQWIQADGLGVIETILQQVVTAENVIITTRERRTLLKQKCEQLEAMGISDYDRIASLLIDLAPHQPVNSFKQLLEHPDHVEILGLLVQAANIHRSYLIAQEAVAKTSKIVFALKSYARKTPIGRMETIDLRRTINNALILHEHHLKHSITLALDWDTPTGSNSPLLVRCFPDELTQVWSNLIGNSVQAIGNKQVGEIAISCQVHDSHVRVELFDNGCGISPEHHDDIFSPFFTTKPLGVGCGLGLDIVSTILKRHHAQIGFSSEPGKGTTFYVTLPLAGSEQDYPHAIAGNVRPELAAG